MNAFLRMFACVKNSRQLNQVTDLHQQCVVLKSQLHETKRQLAEQVQIHANAIADERASHYSLVVDWQDRCAELRKQLHDSNSALVDCRQQFNVEVHQLKEAIEVHRQARVRLVSEMINVLGCLQKDIVWHADELKKLKKDTDTTEVSTLKV